MCVFLYIRFFSSEDDSNIIIQSSATIRKLLTHLYLTIYIDNVEINPNTQ